MGGCSRTHLPSFLALFIVLFFGFSAATEFLVGGKADAWKAPPSGGSDSLIKWAQKLRFQIGDHLIWKYDGGKDSVLEVTKEHYDNCNTSNPMKKHNDGNTKVRFDHPGPYHFISGAKGHCEKGEKLVVVVMSPKGKGKGRSLDGSPAPAPAHARAHSPAPSPAAKASAVFKGPAPAPAPSSGASSALEGGIMFMALGVFGYLGILM